MILSELIPSSVSLATCLPLVEKKPPLRGDQRREVTFFLSPSALVAVGEDRALMWGLGEAIRYVTLFSATYTTLDSGFRQRS